MHTHEFQAKMILREFGVPVPDFAIISTLEELPQALDDLALEAAVVKAQIHAGGRGKAGGVKIGKDREEVKKFVKEMLGKRLVTKQTGKEGIIAETLIISAPIDIAKEYYLGIVLDRPKAQAMLIASPEGGIDIEEVAEKTPHKILKTVPLDGKFKTFQAWEIIKFMGWNGPQIEQGIKLIEALTKAFVTTDAILLEINPLVLTKQGHLSALDAKLSIDDNALFRQQGLAKFYDPSQDSPLEARARENDLAYVALDGEIGCMVNGAGLAMATMDIIHYFGGSPANFLDVGGGATEDKIAEGFKIILSDPKVKAVLVNIFGGIMNCATLAGGIISAAKEFRITCPLIVRMEGTNVETGKQMLAEAGLDIIIADSLKDAAQKSVAAAKRKGK